MVIHQPPPLVICDLDGVIMPILPYVIQSNGSIGDTDWMDKATIRASFAKLLHATSASSAQSMPLRLTTI